MARHFEEATAKNICVALNLSVLVIGGDVPGDPNECRRLAVRCETLAANAPNDQLKRSLMELSYIWHTLAGALEKHEAVVIKTTKPNTLS